MRFLSLSYYQNGVRQRPTFASLQAARDEADVIANRLGNTDADVLTLTSADRAAYLRARQLLDPFGIQIEEAASELVQAKRVLGEVPLLQAAEYYVKRHPAHIPPRPVQAVADEMLKVKQSDGLSDEYLRHLRYDMNRFAAAFHGNIGTVMGPDIDKWLRGLGLSPRTRNNLRASVQTLFAFAKAQRYLPKDHDEIDAVMLAKNAVSEIEIFTPKEMAELLAVATEDQLPFMVISAFAGVRHAELQRLDWKHVNQAAGIIEIRAGAAKTASRRVIPILPNLAAWLEDHWEEAGPVCSFTNMVDQFKDMTRKVNQARRAAWATAKGIGEEALKEADERATKRSLAENKKQTGRRARGSVLPAGADTAAEEGWAPFAWKHNALRHSFISYRVAETQDAAKVSLEAGNSPQMIFKHYRELVRPDAAKAWFSLVPAGKN